jgi:hypothetical protein
MARFYENKKSMKFLVGLRGTSIGHGVIREIKSRFLKLGRKLLILDARKPTISRHKILKDGYMKKETFKVT